MSDTEILNSALLSVGFGTFNVLILLLAIPGSMAIMFATTTMSYIIPRAECDLKLTLTDMATLNSIPYIGMLFFTTIWAILSDNFGRRKLGIITYFLDGIIVILCACSQNKYFLMAFKFLNGATICGAFAVLMTYVSEMHTGKMRTRAVIFIGTTLTITVMVLPAQAIAIIPGNWTVDIANFRFYPWNLYILISALPSFIAGIGFIFMPESPKFSMSQGNYDEALRTLQKMFKMNTGLMVEEFSVKSLGTPKPTQKKTKMELLEQCWINFKPILFPPYLTLALNIFMVEFFVLMCQNTFRLWLPKFFAAIKNSQREGKESNTICEIINYVEFHSKDKIKPRCEVNMSWSHYVNNFYVGSTSIIAYIIAAVVLEFVGAKTVLCTTLGIAAVFASLIPFANTENYVIAVFSIYLAAENIASTYIFNACLHLFPTHMRNTVLGMGMTLGRVGSFIGNLTFPNFINASCLIFSIFVSVVSLAAFFLSLFIPNPAKANQL